MLKPLPLPSSAQMTHVACASSAQASLTGQGHGKGRSFSDSALHRNGSPVMLDDLRHNVEPHAQAGDRLLLRISDPIEPVKNLVALFSWDAQAMVTHLDDNPSFRGAQVNLNRPGIRGILDGITDQVDEDLSEPVRVPDQAGSHRATHHEGMVRTALLQGLGDVLEQGSKVHLVLPIFQPARLDLGNIQQLVYEPGDSVALSPHARKGWGRSLHALLGQLSLH